MNIKVYPYFTEDIYYGGKHKAFFGVYPSSNIRNRLKTEFGITENYGVFVAKVDYSKFTKMPSKKENTKIFNVDMCLPNGEIVPCTCFLTRLKRTCNEEFFEGNLVGYSGKIIENTDKEELDRAYRYNALSDNMEEW